MAFQVVMGKSASFARIALPSTGWKFSLTLRSLEQPQEPPL